MQGTQEAPGTCGSRGLCSVTQEHGECHVWDMGTWRTPRVGHRDVEGATCGTQGRRGCHVWDTGAWRVKRVGHGGVEGATCGTWGHGGCHVWDTGAWRVKCVGRGRGGCHVWDMGVWRVPHVGHIKGHTCCRGQCHVRNPQDPKTGLFPTRCRETLQSEVPKGLEIHVVTNILNILK